MLMTFPATCSFQNSVLNFYPLITQFKFTLSHRIGTMTCKGNIASLGGRGNILQSFSNEQLWKINCKHKPSTFTCHTKNKKNKTADWGMALRNRTKIVSLSSYFTCYGRLHLSPFFMLWVREEIDLISKRIHQC